MRLLLISLLAVLTACSSSDKKEVDEKDLGPKGLPSFNAEISLDAKWKRQLGKGLGNAFAGLEPAVQNGVVYGVDHSGLLQAFKLKNGQQVWKTDFKTSMSAGVALGKQLGFVATSNGEIIAFNLSDGSESWRSNVKSEVLAVPSVKGKYLAAQTADGKLHLLKTSNGTNLWTFDSNLPSLSLRGTSSPLFYRDTVVAGFASGKVVGLNLKDGGLLWQERIGVPAGRSELERLVDVDGSLLIRDDMLYVVGYQGHIAAIDLKAGKFRWKLEASSYHGPVAGLGNLYIVSDDDTVKAIDDRSATDVWSQVDLQGRQLSEATLFAGHLLVADYEGYIHVIKQLDGTIIGRERVVRAPLDWVKTGSYGIKNPSRLFSKDPGIRTRLVTQDNFILAVSNSGLLSVFELN